MRCPPGEQPVELQVGRGCHGPHIMALSAQCWQTPLTPPTPVPVLTVPVCGGRESNFLVESALRLRSPGKIPHGYNRW